MQTTEPDWARLIAEQTTSGMTVDDFCASRGVNKYTFKKRKYSSKRIEATGRADFVELTFGEGTLTVKLRNGLVLEVGHGFKESEVRRLVGVLESC